ncbi:hypothetical protein AWQ24_14940 (plasmid) [Picosynechococcus sp. PCC 8807]|nr:hypothetical protein AWQ24_14940 [Picosynechococcus sp. PCC 8807]
MHYHLTAFRALTLLWVSPALANCPVDFNFGSIVTSIEQADTCEQGINIARQCAFGSTADVMFVNLASEKCLTEIAPLTCNQQTALDDLRQQCRDKYAEFEGTIYRSFAAFCELEVIEAFHSALSDPIDMEF